MKIYELREEEQPCSSWHATKGAALKTQKSALKELHEENPDGVIEMEVWEFDNNREGIVEMLNQIALRELFHPNHNKPTTGTRTVVRVTASKPPVPEGWTHAET